MPVLSSLSKTKRVILGKEGDEDVWVEIKTQVLMQDLYKDETAKEIKSTAEILASIIVDWNFTQESGEKAPISKETVMLLPVEYIVEIQRHVDSLLRIEPIDPAKKKI